MTDPKDDDIIAWELTEQELEGVDGGITLDNGIKFRAKVDGVNNDTLFAGVNNDTLIGAPTSGFKRKR